MIEFKIVIIEIQLIIQMKLNLFEVVWYWKASAEDVRPHLHNGGGPPNFYHEISRNEQLEFQLLQPPYQKNNSNKSRENVPHSRRQYNSYSINSNDLMDKWSLNGWKECFVILVPGGAGRGPLPGGARRQLAAGSADDRTRPIVLPLSRVPAD